MSNAKLTQEDVEQILRIIESAGHIAEFRLKYGEVEVVMSREGSDGGMHPSPRDPRAQPPRVEESASPLLLLGQTEGSLPEGSVAVKAPMVGTLYRAPSPGLPPFIEVGQKVEWDTTVCIIEVMKLMTSVPAGVRGTVNEIRVADGQPVEFGQVLIVIQPDG